jgi:signal transduction histidine kinase
MPQPGAMIAPTVSREHSNLRWVPVVLAPVMAAYGVAAAAIATRHGAVHRSALTTTVELAAGWALIAVGLATWWRHPRRCAGPVAVIAGVAWLAPDFVGWQGGPGAVRTLALAATGLGAAAVAEIAMARRGRPLVAAIWVLTLAIALSRVLAYDPFADPHCFTYCAHSPLVVGGGSRSMAVALDRIDAGLAMLIALVTAGAAITRRSRSLALPALLFACGWAARSLALALAPGDDPRRPVLVASFAVRAMAMVLLAAALVWALSRTRRAIAALRRLVSEGSGSFQAALARGTGDRSLRVAFAAGDSGGWIDGDGHPLEVPDRRRLHVIAREGRPIAAVVHDPEGFDGAALGQEIGPAAQLALENERLRADARAQARELEASRVRIVETGDAERRRLERDLHDGAQQRLVGLSMALAMARDAFATDIERVRALEAAGGQLQAAIVELREIAHGIHPVELTDEGLAAALETLTDRAAVPVALDAVLTQGLPVPVETAAYMLVDEVVRLAAQRGDGAELSVAARCDANRLTVEVRDPHAAAARLQAELVDVADRVHALRGMLTIEDTGGVRVRAELPCG